MRDRWTDNIAQINKGLKEINAAVEKGLEWLSRHQDIDGKWILTNDNCQTCPVLKSIPGSVIGCDSGVTGLVLLSYLGTGYNHEKGKYKDIIGLAVNYLLSIEKNGDLRGKNKERGMYSQGIATIALCEAYSMTNDIRLKEPCRRAINFIVSSQEPGYGGWRYIPGSESDTSVTGWQLMALRSGQAAGFNVPEKTFKAVSHWLDFAKGGKSGGLFQYRRGEGVTTAMVAEGLFCRQLLGMGKNDPAMQEGIDYLLKRLPSIETEDLYYWYYGSLTCYQYGDEIWEKWNENLKKVLLNRQEKFGHLLGSWEPKGKWELIGGRTYTTALALLCLETSYRYLKFVK